MKDSLGGNSKTSLIIAVSPSEYNIEESISSMLFGQRARKITNKLTQNLIDIDFKSLYEKLIIENDQLKEKILELTSNTTTSTESKDTTNGTKMSDTKTEDVSRIEDFYSQLMSMKDNEIEVLKKEMLNLNISISKTISTETASISKLISTSTQLISKSTNTDNSSFPSDFIKILENLYNKNSNWSLEHLEELMKVFNEDNLALNQQVDSLKNDNSNKNYKIMKLKEKSKEAQAVITDKTDLITKLQIELNKSNEIINDHQSKITQIHEELDFYLSEDKDLKKNSYETHKRLSENSRLLIQNLNETENNNEYKLKIDLLLHENNIKNLLTHPII